MTRMWIVLGDRASSGGQVITGSPFTDIDGRFRFSDQPGGRIGRCNVG